MNSSGLQTPLSDKKPAPVEEEKEEDASESEEEQAPATNYRSAGFANLMGSSSEDDDSEEDNDDDDDNDKEGRAGDKAEGGEDKNAEEQPSPPRDTKKGKGKGRGGQKKSKEPIIESEGEEEEIDDTDDWKALEEAEKENLGLDPTAAADSTFEGGGSSSSSSTVAYKPNTLDELLKCVKSNFSPEAEYKRVFGGQTISTASTSKKKKGLNITQLPLHMKKLWLTHGIEIEQVGPTKPDVQKAGKCHMALITDPKQHAECKKFNIFDIGLLPDSPKADQIREEYVDVVNSFDLESLVGFVRQFPFYVCGLLQFAEVQKTRDDHAQAMMMIKRALFSLECNFHVRFQPLSSGTAGGGDAGGTTASSSGGASSGASMPEAAVKLSAGGLQSLGRGLWLYMICLAGQGLFNTACEVSKLLWKLAAFVKYDPGSNRKKMNVYTPWAIFDDPLHMGIWVLYYSIRCRKYDYVDDFCTKLHLSDPKIDSAKWVEYKSQFDATEDEDSAFTELAAKYDASSAAVAAAKERKEANAGHPPPIYLCCLYPYMMYSLALCAFYKTENAKDLRKDVLSASEICNWKAFGKSGTEKLVKAIYLYPYQFRLLLERAEVNLDTKPSGVPNMVSKKTWMDLFNQIQDFGYQKHQCTFHFFCTSTYFSFSLC